MPGRRRASRFTPSLTVATNPGEVNLLACHESSAPYQLAFPIGDQALPADRWNALPGERRAEVLALLGRLIARGVLAGQVEAFGIAPLEAACAEAGFRRGRAG
jgi:hypothetical protein